MDKRIWGIIGGLALVLALLSPYVLGSTKKVARLFEVAETLYEQNDYARAIAKYSEALKESNKLRAKTETIDKDFTTLVNFKIAMSYVQLAEYEKALEYIEKAAQTVKLLEYEENLTYLWGYILYKTGQLEEASEKLSQLLDKFPNSRFSEKVQETITQINAQLSNREKNEKVVHPKDTTPPWINDLSKFEAFNKERNQKLVVPNRLRAEKKFAQAAGEYETFAIDYPTTKQAAYALYWTGFCYSPDSTATLSDKSIAIFRKLIDNYPESLYAAKAREKLESIPNEDLDEEIERQIERKNNHFSRGVEHFENRAYARAIDSLTKALEIDSQFKEAYYQLGAAYLKNGEFECALECARKALVIDPNYKDASDLINSIDTDALNGECEHNIP